MKPQISNRLVIAAMFIAVVPIPLAAEHQDNNQASTQIASQGTPDRFVGIWKLRVKTQSAGTVSQVVTIENQGGDYRLTYDVAVNGHEDHMSYVTDMKGETVKSVQHNGQPTPGKSRFTRIDSSSFKVESEIAKDIYKVSPDGQTMRVKQTYLVITSPNVLKDGELLFDRQK